MKLGLTVDVVRGSRDHGADTVVPSSALIATGVVPMDVEKAAGSDHDVEMMQAAEAGKEDDKQGTGKAKAVKGVTMIRKTHGS